ncbi:MAG TPA: chemotaxis protein CheB [Chthoniobacteraceae bacterium]|nr:chemotaxis protein CheB [Chthoniobacteraceae bacterium]
MKERPSSRTIQAIVIGASAGAVDALLQILPQLPDDYSLTVLIVVHLPPDSESTLVPLLASRCRINVKEAEDKEPIQPGTVYLAPPNYHLLVEPELILSLSSEEPVLFSRPSIDVLFESAAEAYGDSLAGIVLTGGNADGAQGLMTVESAGGLTFVQTPGTAAFSEMPQAALDACPNARSLSLQDLATVLKEELPHIRR